MPAEVESMFYVRETPWHGLGTNVDHALNSNDAITLAGLDWNVIQKEAAAKNMGILAITHNRHLANKIATRIVEWP